MLKIATISKGTFLKNQGCQNLLLLRVPFQQKVPFFEFCPPGKKTWAPTSRSELESSLVTGSDVNRAAYAAV